MKGFQCHALDERRLNLSSEDVFNVKRLPSVLDPRLVGSKKVGVEGEVVYVAWHLKTVNGLTQILRQRPIRPQHKVDGTQGGCRLSRPQNGRNHIRA